MIYLIYSDSFERLLVDLPGIRPEYAVNSFLIDTQLEHTFSSNLIPVSRVALSTRRGRRRRSKYNSRKTKGFEDRANYKPN